MSKYRVISGPYFLAFRLNTESPDAGKYGQEITPYLDTFHAFQTSASVSENSVTCYDRVSRELWKLYYVERECLFDTNLKIQ